MPGLAAPAENGGIGFDYRFAMGVPDYWIKLIKDMPDENWPVGTLWYELTNRRMDEKTISYAESHDQALVGDQSIIFRLIGAQMYDHMQRDDQHMDVDRGIALHKMIRLITLATAGDGYLNFMGNEFGHPEWIDFPREGNNWSFKYARRQWHLMDDPDLKYQYLACFDRDMVSLAQKFKLLEAPTIHLLHEHSDDKVLVFERANLILAFNFHPLKSFTDYRFEASPGKYRMIFTSDASLYGGHQRLVPDQVHFTLKETDQDYDHFYLSLYLPSRTALVLQKEKNN
jgi:1,4-alpha-glucan branching enzyme